VMSRPYSARSMICEARLIGSLQDAMCVEFHSAT